MSLLRIKGFAPFLLFRGLQPGGRGPGAFDLRSPCYFEDSGLEIQGLRSFLLAWLAWRGVDIGTGVLVLCTAFVLEATRPRGRQSSLHRCCVQGGVRVPPRHGSHQPCGEPEVSDYVWVLHSQIRLAWFQTRSPDVWFEVWFDLRPNSNPLRVRVNLMDRSWSRWRMVRTLPCTLDYRVSCLEGRERFLEVWLDSVQTFFIFFSAYKYVVVGPVGFRALSAFLCLYYCTQCSTLYLSSHFRRHWLLAIAIDACSGLARLKTNARQRPRYAAMSPSLSSSSHSSSSSSPTGVIAAAPPSTPAADSFFFFERVGPSTASDRKNYDLGRLMTSKWRVYEMEALGYFPVGNGMVAGSEIVPQPVGEVVVFENFFMLDWAFRATSSWLMFWISTRCRFISWLQTQSLCWASLYRRWPRCSSWP